MAPNCQVSLEAPVSAQKRREGAPARQGVSASLRGAPNGRVSAALGDLLSPGETSACPHPA